jgi:Serine carboxypeptidase
MKRSIVLLLLSSLVLLGTTFVDARLHGESNGGGDDDMSCANAKDESSCFATNDDSGMSCVWCSCSAVPSECLTQDQSKLVPPGVFNCKSPSTTSTTTTFTTLERMTLAEHAVDDDFCDSNSMSGYISIDESTYDKDGENKHLFYWMFAKRNADIKDSTIPFIVWLTGGPGCSSSL